MLLKTLDLLHDLLSFKWRSVYSYSGRTAYHDVCILQVRTLSRPSSSAKTNIAHQLSRGHVWPVDL